MNISKIENYITNNKNIQVYYNNITNYICTTYLINGEIDILLLKKKFNKLLYNCNKVYTDKNKNDNNNDDNIGYIFETIYDKSIFFIDIKNYLIKNFIDNNLENIILWLINNTHFFNYHISTFYGYLFCTKLWNNDILLNKYIDTIQEEKFEWFIDYFYKFMNICNYYNKTYIIIKLLSHQNIKNILNNNNNDIITYIFASLINNYIFNSTFNQDVFYDFYNIYKHNLISCINNDFIYTYLSFTFQHIFNYQNNKELNNKTLLKDMPYLNVSLLLLIDKYFFQNILTNINIYTKYITIKYIDKVYDKFYKILTWLLIENEDLINIQINNELMFQVLFINYSNKNINFFMKLFKHYRYTTKLEKSIYYYTKNTNVYYIDKNDNLIINKNNYIKKLLLWNYLSYGINTQNHKIMYQLINNNNTFKTTFKSIFRNCFSNVQKNIKIFYYLNKKQYLKLYSLFDYDNIINNNQCDECPISFDKCNMITNCNHKFDFNSFIGWYLLNKKCPLCRGYIKLDECKKIQL
jgi:hypothetical protein